MMHRRLRVPLALSLALAASAAMTRMDAQAPRRGLRVEISFPAAARSQAVTGMVYLAISRTNRSTPIEQADPEGSPLFSAYVENLQPGTPAVITRENRG